LKEAPPSIVVDANCFRYYIGEIVGEVRATYFDAFSHIFKLVQLLVTMRALSDLNTLATGVLQSTRRKNLVGIYLLSCANLQ